MKTGNTARQGMYIFVAVIFTVAIVVAGAYVMVAKPGESADKPVSDVINPNS